MMKNFLFYFFIIAQINPFAGPSEIRYLTKEEIIREQVDEEAEEHIFNLSSLMEFYFSPIKKEYFLKKYRETGSDQAFKLLCIIGDKKLLWELYDEVKNTTDTCKRSALASGLLIDRNLYKNPQFFHFLKENIQLGLTLPMGQGWRGYDFAPLIMLKIWPEEGKKFLNEILKSLKGDDFQTSSVRGDILECFYLQNLQPCVLNDKDVSEDADIIEIIRILYSGYLYGLDLHGKTKYLEDCNFKGIWINELNHLVFKKIFLTR